VTAAPITGEDTALAAAMDRNRILRVQVELARRRAEVGASAALVRHRIAAALCACCSRERRSLASLARRLP